MSFNPAVLPAQDDYTRRDRPSHEDRVYSSPSDLRFDDPPAPKAKASRKSSVSTPATPAAPGVTYGPVKS